MKRTSIINALVIIAFLLMYVIPRARRFGAKYADDAASHTPAQPVEQSPSSVTQDNGPLVVDSEPNDSPALHELSKALDTAYISTIAAFEIYEDESDYETHGRQVQNDAEQLERVFTSSRSDLGVEITTPCEALLERIAAAQLQIMAFAINRKNRGPDSVQDETEASDRSEFKKSAEPLYTQLKQAISASTLKSTLSM